MQKLNKFARNSSLMDLEIRVGDEVIKFNLYKELHINTADINHEVTRQPQLYGFLGMVSSTLAMQLEKGENNKDRIFEKLYGLYKRKISPVTKRPYSDDLCKSKALTNPKYQKALSTYITLKYNLKKINTALDAFKQRKDLLQTFSSNNRNNT